MGHPVPGVVDVDLVPGALGERQLHELVGADGRLPVDGGDHVPGGEPGRLSGAAGVDTGDQEALGVPVDCRRVRREAVRDALPARTDGPGLRNAAGDREEIREAPDTIGLGSG